MDYLKHIGVVVTLTALAGCSDDNDNNQDSQLLADQALVQKVSPVDMQGLWRSDGYLTYLDISDERVRSYEVSSVHCLLVNSTALSEYVEENPHFLSNGERKRFATDPDLDRDAIHPYFFDRIDQQPTSCVSGITAKTNDPVDNFTVFWNVFNEQYAFFDLRAINWQQQYDDNIAAAENANNDDELFDIFASMIEAFNNDSHVSLEAGDYAEVGAGVPSALVSRLIEQFQDTFSEQQLLAEFNNQTEYSNIDDYVENRFASYYSVRLQDAADIIAGYMLGNGLKSAANEQILWGLMQSNIGYLRIASMFEFIDIEQALEAIENGTLDEADAIEQIFTAANSALDQVMADLSDTDAMIIDIRTNGGGFDSLGLEIAGRFFDQRRLVFRKKARKGDGYSEEVEIFQAPTVEDPYTKPIYLLTSGQTASAAETTVEDPYTKPIYLLTSGQTASAAETFTISMKSLPHVTLVGETTEGILSDIQELSLPNDWSLGLSNEVYTSADNIVFESVGIAPQITALFLDPDYEANQQDAALEAAIQDL